MCYRDNLAFARPLPLFKTNAIIRFHRLKNLCADLSATQKILLSDSRRSLKSRDKFSFEQHLPSVFTNLSSFHGDDNFLMYQHVYLYHAYTEDQLLTYPALYYPISMHPPANLLSFFHRLLLPFAVRFLIEEKAISCTLIALLCFLARLKLTSIVMQFSPLYKHLLIDHHPYLVLLSVPLENLFIRER